MAFVVLDREQFERALPQGYREVLSERAWEIIYEIPTPKAGVGVRIYSTVDKRTGVTRGIGEDAIRIVYWDLFNDRPLGKGKKILRVEGRTTIESRIISRINEFLSGSNNVSPIDYNYVRAILEHGSVSWMEFAQSLLEKLNQYGSLTDGQLAYILGETNPKNKPTFEARVLSNDGSFSRNFLESQMEEPDENEAVQEKRPEVEASDSAEEVLPVRLRESEGTIQDQLGGKLKKKEKREKIRMPIGDRTETKNYEYHKYSFEKFNPVQSMVLPYQKHDCNLIIGANTSAGKTICAEIIMDQVLASGKRVVYMSPLKSLTQEKFTDWERRYPNEKITILTGDYVLNQEIKAELAGSRIIVMTSEMVDSRTRRMRAEQNYWLMEVGLLIVDESHIITTSRGHAVENGIMRFSKINPNARILLLSATMPNCDELAVWLHTLNGKESNVIYSTWRPVTLKMNYLEYRVEINHYGRENYWATQENKKQLVMSKVMSKPNEKFLVFVHDKGTGRDLVKRFAEMGERALFHNADLDLEERLDVENDFANRNGGLRILISTSTLAWGRNLPARNVVVCGVHRGLTEVDPLDIIQMAGRAGRYGIDDEGHVFLVIPEGTTATWTNKFSNPRPVSSILKDKNIMAFHALAEIDNREITNSRDLYTWYSRSLAHKQEMEFTQQDADELVGDLVNMEMIIHRPGSNQLSSTRLGKVSSWLYFSPYDVYNWYSNIKRALASPCGLTDMTLSWAVGDIQSNDWGYIPRDIESCCNTYASVLNQVSNGTLHVGSTVPFCFAYMECLRGTEQKTSPVSALMRSIKFDIRRISQAIALIDSMYAQWGKDEVWKTLPLRIEYGVPESMVPLVRLPGIGGVRAKKLWENDIRSLNDVVSIKGKAVLATMFQPTMVIRIQRKAKEFLGVDPDLELDEVVTE